MCMSACALQGGEVAAEPSAEAAADTGGHIAKVAILHRWSHCTGGEAAARPSAETADKDVETELQSIFRLADKVCARTHGSARV